MIETIIANINEVLWGRWRVLIYILIGAGLWFSARLGMLQLRQFGHMFSLMRGSRKADQSGISSFQALCTSLSARVGMGNLAGVAMAISVGGAGAVFWMWLIAFLGMATGFAESLLAQVYKVRDAKKEFRGGPAYYIRQGLNKPWLALLFSLCLFLGYGIFFSALQANTITDALSNAYHIPTQYAGLVIIVFAGIIVVGGLRSIARFAEIIVPIMGVVYFLTALGITLVNIDLVPSVLWQIVASAFGLQEAAGGAIGAALQAGIQRGLYSNEAGAGSAPHAAASASPDPKHPASQGYIQMLGVFFDTIVLCTCTAVIILLSGYTGGGSAEGIRLTQEAMSHHLGGWGIDYVAVAITVFAFTSVVANYAYAQSNLRFFNLDNRLGNTAYFIAYLAMVYWGANASLTQVWAAADMAMGLMTVVNVTALILLTPTIVAVSRDYLNQQKSGNESEYQRHKVEIQGVTEDGVWD